MLPALTSTLLLLASLLSSMLSGLAPMSLEASKPAPSQCGAGLITLDYGDLDRTRPHNLTYIVMNAWDAHRIGPMKKANPGMKFLMYQDLSAVRMGSHESGMASTGLVGKQMRESWYLHKPNGQRARWADYPELYAANVGKKAYQAAWLASVKRNLARGAWDGVMLDDTLTTLSHPLVGGGKPQEIASDASMYRATESALRHIGPRLKKAGYMAVPNITVFWDNWEKPIKTWSKYVSGWENEFQVKWGLTRMARFNESNDWGWKYSMASWLAGKKIPLLAVTYSNRSDKAAQLYHRASWLLSWNGRDGASVFVPFEDRVNHDTRLATLDPGKPRSEARRKKGLYVRTYSRGLVLANPTNRTHSVKLAKPRYTPNGKVVRRVTLGPTKGLIVFNSRESKRRC